MTQRFITLIFLLFSTVALAQPKAIKSISVNGIDGQLKDNVVGFVAPFIAGQFGDYERSEMHKDVLQAMQALGYYQTKVIFNKPYDSDSLNIDIVPGEPMLWRSVDIKIAGQANLDDKVSALLANIDIKKGKRVRHDLYEGVKGALESLLLERGYFDFNWLRTELRVNKGQNYADAVLHIDSGVRYLFGQVHINEQTLAQNYIRTLATFKRGDAYSTALLSDYNLALNSTPYFTTAKVYPLLKDRKNGQVPIHVEVVDKPANSYEVGGGYSTDLGAKLRFKWSKPWITDDGHFADSNLTLSQRQQDLTGSYVIPVDNPNDDLWRILGGYQRKNDVIEGIETQIWSVQLQRQWLTSDNWVRTAFIKREHESNRQDGSVLRTEMLLPGISYAKKQRLGGTLPYWGNERLLSVEMASDSLISSTSLIKFRWNNAWLRNFGKEHLVYSRLDLGAIVTDDIEQVPLNMRFFAGGDQSIRGFSYQSVAPRQDGQLVGAKYLVTSTLEYNYQFLDDWRGAVFVDAGTATNDFSEKWAVGAGVGLRYLTPIGPIRLDLAWGVSKDSKSARLSIVIGPEI